MGNLNKLVALAQGKLQLKVDDGSLVGPMTLQMSYFEIMKTRKDLKEKSRLLMEMKSQYLHENYGVIEKQNGKGALCDYVVVDTHSKKFYFYSRFVNSSILCSDENFASV